MRKTRCSPPPPAGSWGSKTRRSRADSSGFPACRIAWRRSRGWSHVLFVNDSKATNADAASKALASYIDIYWIIGGKAKEGGIESLRAFFPLVVKAYLIGEASDDFARTLEGAVPYERCGTLEVATERAARDASASKTSAPVVLLSPACASYDQFANFEARGDAFRGLAQRLAASGLGDAS